MRNIGKVILDGDGELKVSIQRPTECEHCGMCNGRTLLVDLPEGKWNVGDTVEIEMPSDNLLRASALTYLVPLAGLIIGLIIGEMMGSETKLGGDGLAAVLGIAGVALGYMCVKLIAPRLRRKGALRLDITPCGRAAGDLAALQQKKSDSTAEK